jgi:hypothetical protein
LHCPRKQQRRCTTSCTRPSPASIDEVTDYFDPPLAIDAARIIQMRDPVFILLFFPDFHFIFTARRPQEYMRQYIFGKTTDIDSIARCFDIFFKRITR